MAALTPEEQALLARRAKGLAEALCTWAARFPSVRQVRAWPLALSVAAAAPFASEQALLDTARLSLWVFTLDDLFDEGGLGHAVLQRRAARYKAVVHGDTSRAWPKDPLAQSLLEVRQALSSYPLYEALGDHWETALCGTIDTMVVEDRWRRAWARNRLALPSFDEYLAVGRYSIGGPPHIWAAILTADDPTAAAHLERLSELERLASCCIRLANDLRSWRKELAEGTVNALAVLGAATGTERDAITVVEAQIADLQARVMALAALEPGTASGNPEAAIVSIAAMVSDYYRNHDYHELVPPALSSETPAGLVRS